MVPLSNLKVEIGLLSVAITRRVTAVYNPQLRFDQSLQDIFLGRFYFDRS
jgi:hypothetical protein